MTGFIYATNNNCDSYQVHIRAASNDNITLNLIYYSFLLEHPSAQALGLGSTESRDIGDEVDFIVDLTLTNWWTASATPTGSPFPAAPRDRRPVDRKCGRKVCSI